MTERQKTLMQIITNNHELIMDKFPKGIRTSKEDSPLKKYQANDEIEALLFGIMAQQQEIIDSLEKFQVRTIENTTNRMRIEGQMVNPNPELKLKK